MKSKLVIAFLTVAALAACGGKAKKSTTPENKGDTTTETKTEGASTGGASYGGATPAAAPATSADPCAAE